MENERTPEALTTQDVSLLRSLEHGRLGTRFAIDSVLFASILGAAKMAYFGDWHVLLDLENLVGGGLVATLSAVGHVSLSRRLLGRTAGETRVQMRRDWHILTDPGWPVRVLGLSAGAAAFFVIFSFALVALSEPIPGLRELILEGLELFVMGLILLTPAGFLARAALVKGLRRDVEPNEAILGPGTEAPERATAAASTEKA